MSLNRIQVLRFNAKRINMRRKVMKANENISIIMNQLYTQQCILVQRVVYMKIEKGNCIQHVATNHSCHNGIKATSQVIDTIKR